MLKGYKTVLTAIAIALIPATEFIYDLFTQDQISQLLTREQLLFVLVCIPIIQVILRKFTDTPIFRKDK